MIKKFAIFLCFMLVACNAPPESADAVYTDGSIWTGVPGAARAEAIAVKGERILAIGSLADVQAYIGDATVQIDLDGKTVIPGLTDNHTHFLYTGLAMDNVDLSGATDEASFQAAIAAFMATNPGDGWLEGGAWRKSTLKASGLPTKAWLDAVTGDRPAFATEIGYHMGVANSKALVAAGITAATPDPLGGVIDRDDAGVATGILRDTAMDLVLNIIPPVTEAAEEQALMRAVDHALSLGLTQIDDLGDDGSVREIQTYRRLRAKGALKIRAYAVPLFHHWEALQQNITTQGGGDDWLRYGGVKIYVDGAMGARTVWFHAPYADGTREAIRGDESQMRETLIAADAAGLQVLAHAQGDAAIDWILDVREDMERLNGPRDRRMRIEHASFPSAAAIRRMADLQVIASVQPSHKSGVMDALPAALPLATPGRRMNYRDLRQAGVPMTLGSDWNVLPLNPMLGIHGAVTRFSDARLNISVEDAVTAYTSTSAFARFQEADTGTLAPGKWADFTVLSEDIFAVSKADIPAITALMTVVGGTVQYQKP